MELKGKLGQSSVNGLLNNSSSVNFLFHFQTLWKSTLSEEKRSGKKTNQDSHCHGYALFQFTISISFTTSQLKLEP